MEKSFLMARWISVVLIFWTQGSLAQADTAKLLTPLQKAETSAQQKPSIGILAGISDPQNGQHTVGNYGIEMAVQPYVPISAALELSLNNFPSEGTSPS